MTDYTPNEIVVMILILGKCHNNYDAERFPDRRHPTNSRIQHLTQRACNRCLVRQRRRQEYNENTATYKK